LSTAGAFGSRPARTRAARSRSSVPDLQRNDYELARRLQEEEDLAAAHIMSLEERRHPVQQTRQTHHVQGGRQYWGADEMYSFVEPISHEERPTIYSTEVHPQAFFRSEVHPETLRQLRPRQTFWQGLRAALRMRRNRSEGLERRRRNALSSQFHGETRYHADEMARAARSLEPARAFHENQAAVTQQARNLWSEVTAETLDVRESLTARRMQLARDLHVPAATSEEIAELPVHRFRESGDPRMNTAERNTCCICLEQYKRGEILRTMPCMHQFHARCIDMWLLTRKFCPVCKDVLEIDRRLWS